MTTHRLFTALAAAAMLASAGAAHATEAASGPSVSDFSFESPALGEGQYTYAPDGADGLSYTLGGGVQSNGSIWGFQDAPDGVQTGFIQSTGSLTLDVTGLTVGQAYDFTVSAAQRPGYSVNPIAVSYTNDEVDPPLGTIAPTSANWADYTTDSFVATAGSGSVTFTGLNSNAGGDFDSGIDNVRINAVSAAPEPSSWALMIAGLGGIGLAFRQAKRRHGFRFKDAFAA